ncbi:MAG TPA: hypothetical protein VL326_32320 [Kofleriaceae bacterium]|jgi:hypothetical protein|nr:hypothetical protein [Kofleriaceae bacterium]
MKKLLHITLALSLASLVGCANAEKEIQKFADQTCACKDTACAEKAINDFSTWAHAHKDAKGDEDKAKTAFEKMFKCAAEKGVAPEKILESVKGLE